MSEAFTQRGRRPSADPSVQAVMLVLKGERERRGLSQSEIARRMGVQPAAVSRWESGHRDLRIATFLRYCRALFGSREARW